MRAGMSRVEATRAARMELGSVEAVKDVATLLLLRGWAVSASWHEGRSGRWPDAALRARA
jgi:hypothetical protein